MYDDIMFASIMGILAIMLKTWFSHRERMKGISQPKASLPASDDRLARLEQAVESIAIEVERIGEGQRFVTKVMSEKAQLPLRDGLATPVQQRKLDTPH